MPSARSIASGLIALVLAVASMHVEAAAAQPTISAPPDMTVPEMGGSGASSTVSIDIRLSVASSQVVTVVATFSATTAERGQCGATADFFVSGSDPRTVTFPANSRSQTIIVGICGDDLVEGNEQFKLTLSNPVNATILDGETTITIDDDDDAPAPRLYFSAANLYKLVNEGDQGTQNVTFNLTLSPASSQPVTVRYQTSDTTATGGSSCTGAVDYVTSSGTVAFAPGETQKSIVITVCGDLAFDAPVERMHVILGGATGGAAIGAPSSLSIPLQGVRARVEITDDDLPRITVGNASVAEKDAGQASAALVLKLAKAMSQSFTLGYATGPGVSAGAIAGTACVGLGDYISTSGTVTFAPGEVSKTISVTICGDINVELEENFDLDFTSPSGPPLAAPTSTRITIPNDDIATLSISDGSVVADTLNHPVDAVLTVRLSAQPMPNQHASINYATSDGSLTGGPNCGPGIGYVSKGGSLAFRFGESLTQTISVKICKTALPSSSALKVQLSGPGNATISNATSIIRIKN